MIFTRRTYRVAIRRSIKKEAKLIAAWDQAEPGRESIDAWHTWCTQINRTRKLQTRKRKERK